MQSPLQDELAQAERLAVRRAVSQDGIYDIFCGLCLLLWAGLLALDQGAFGGVAFAIGLPVLRRWRTHFLAPRMGHVQLRRAPELKRKRGLALVFTMTLVLGVAVFFIAQADPEPMWFTRLRDLGAVMPGLILAFTLSCAGWIYGMQRLQVYAATTVVTFVLYQAFSADSSSSVFRQALVPSSLVPVLVGCTLLIRFLKANPVVEPTQELQ